jgi:hypothetical protein
MHPWLAGRPGSVYWWNPKPRLLDKLKYQGISHESFSELIRMRAFQFKW